MSVPCIGCASIKSTLPLVPVYPAANSCYDINARIGEAAQAVIAATAHSLITDDDISPDSFIFCMQMDTAEALIAQERFAEALECVNHIKIPSQSGPSASLVLIKLKISCMLLIKEHRNPKFELKEWSRLESQLEKSSKGREIAYRWHQIHREAIDPLLHNEILNVCSIIYYCLNRVPEANECLNLICAYQKDYLKLQIEKQMEQEIRLSNKEASQKLQHGFYKRSYEFTRYATNTKIFEIDVAIAIMNFLFDVNCDDTFRDIHARLIKEKTAAEQEKIKRINSNTVYDFLDEYLCELTSFLQVIDCYMNFFALSEPGAIPQLNAEKNKACIDYYSQIINRKDEYSTIALELRALIYFRTGNIEASLADTKLLKDSSQNSDNLLKANSRFSALKFLQSNILWYQKTLFLRVWIARDANPADLQQILQPFNASGGNCQPILWSNLWTSKKCDVGVKQAAEFLDVAVKLTASAYWQKIRVHYYVRQLKKYDEALRFLENPNNDMAWTDDEITEFNCIKAEAYINLRRFDDAIFLMGQELTTFSVHPWILYLACHIAHRPKDVNAVLSIIHHTFKDKLEALKKELNAYSQPEKCTHYNNELRDNVSNTSYCQDLVDLAAKAILRKTKDVCAVQRHLPATILSAHELHYLRLYISKMGKDPRTFKNEQYTTYRILRTREITGYTELYDLNRALTEYASAQRIFSLEATPWSSHQKRLQLAFWNNNWEEAKKCLEYLNVKKSILVNCYSEVLSFIEYFDAENGKQIVDRYIHQNSLYKGDTCQLRSLCALVQYKLGKLAESEAILKDFSEENKADTLLLRLKMACHKSVEAVFALLNPLAEKGGDFFLAASDTVSDLIFERKYEVVLPFLNTLIGRYPYRTSLLHFRSLVFFYLDRQEECLNDIKKVEAFNPKFAKELTEIKAGALFTNGDFQDALDICLEACQSDSMSCLLVLQLAISDSIDDTESSTLIIGQLIGLRPSDLKKMLLSYAAIFINPWQNLDSPATRFLNKAYEDVQNLLPPDLVYAGFEASSSL